MLKVRIKRPVAVSQTAAHSSPLAAATKLPSRLKAHPRWLGYHILESGGDFRLILASPVAASVSLDIPTPARLLSVGFQAIRALAPLGKDFSSSPVRISHSTVWSPQPASVFPSGLK